MVRSVPVIPETIPIRVDVVSNGSSDAGGAAAEAGLEETTPKFADVGEKEDIPVTEVSSDGVGKEVGAGVVGDGVGDGVVGVGVGDPVAGSTLHVEEQPSPFIKLPSSHCSPASWFK